ncbi:MAG: hypothetical protein ACYS17_16525 [Planctomycetota bacterium]|jgi:hypothetical protein
MSGTVGHTTNLNFAKLTFAQLQGWTYEKAKTIQLKIQVQKSGENSGNGGNILQLLTQISEGTLFGVDDISINGGIIYLPAYQDLAGANQGVDTIRLDNTWSKNTWRAQISDTIGILGRIYDDPQSPTGKALIMRGFSGVVAPNAQSSLYRVFVQSFDGSGLPVWGTPQYIQGEGNPANASNGAAPVDISPVLSANGMPVIIAGKYQPGTTTRPGNVLVNTANAVNPAYTAWLDLSAIDNELRASTLARSDSSGRIYIPSVNQSNTIFNLSRLVFSGTNGDVSSLTNSANWTAERIGSCTVGTPAAGGLGNVAEFKVFGVAVDEDNPVNGQPTIYATDETNEVIFKITHAGTAFGDERDWLWVIWAGQNGVSGDSDGIGIAASFFNPRGIIYQGGFLYVSDKGNRLLRKIDISTAEVSTFYGQSGVLAHTDQFSF